MLIGFISDLHVENHKYSIKEYIQEIRTIAQGKNLDMLVIGGDIANHYSVTLDFIENLQDFLDIPVYFIPGNHDFWDRENPQEQINTQHIYEIYRAHPQSLLESPLMLNKEVGLVGHTGWYNYVRYNRDRFSEEQVERGRFKGVSWQDKKFIRWPESDKEISKLFADKVKQDMDSLAADKLILVTHIVTIPEFTMPIPHRVFDFFNAYIATDDFQDIYADYPIEHSFMGHVHFRHRHQEDNLKFYANSLGYVKEWRSHNIQREIESALVVLEV